MFDAQPYLAAGLNTVFIFDSLLMKIISQN